MKHFGDITKLSGYELPIVDVITGGSPCQDLSVAGKRAGLNGERSGLFMEQIRIVKEMREEDVRTNGRSGFLVRPRYMVWENVPGAFSSGNPKGSDFAAVLEEIIKACEQDASVHVCIPDGGWTKSGCYYAEDGTWSIAWRVHDAQFWGMPQRRKRIALVADFNGLSATEILFERQGVRRNTEESSKKTETNPGRIKDSTSNTSAISFQERAGKPGGGKGILIQNEHVGALSTLNNQSVFTFNNKTIANRYDRSELRPGKPSGTLTADHETMLFDYLTIRRLTPGEYGRLQGYPDGWCDIGEWVDSQGKKHRDADTPKYKAYGNSIAVGYANKKSGFWCWLARRICSQYERQVTMASLFDGIGGFPLCFEQAGCKALWASEIEEFCIAVTKKHFPEAE